MHVLQCIFSRQSMKKIVEVKIVQKNKIKIKKKKLKKKDCIPLDCAPKEDLDRFIGGGS